MKSSAWRLSRLLFLVLMSAACGPNTQPVSTAPSTPPGGPAAITQSPNNAGVAALTNFSFAALNFNPRPGGTLRYSWDFGDGLAEPDSTATATHVYLSAGTFAVKVNAVDSNAGMVDTVEISGIRVVNLTGSWGIRAPGGGFVVNRGMFLSQSGSTLRGDITYIAGCLVAVNGSITGTESLNLSFTLPASNGCKPFPIPLPSSFSGTADESIHTFTGTLTGVGPTTISRCAENTSVVNCQ